MARMLFIRGVLFTSSVSIKPSPAVQLIKMSTYLCIFSLLSTVSSLDPLETLLQSPISEARCLAACLMLPSPGSRAQCLQVCRFRQQHPDTDLCQVPGLCVDLGCQVACQDITLLPHSGMFTSFTRSGCRLSWSVGEMMAGADVVFVMAGEDSLEVDVLRAFAEGDEELREAAIAAQGRGAQTAPTAPRRRGPREARDVRRAARVAHFPLTCAKAFLAARCVDERPEKP